tara:strand:+ start:4330 stop:4542 length:213 start_codon:yes stop_codon:yes gene_type:complete
MGLGMAPFQGWVSWWLSAKWASPTFELCCPFRAGSFGGCQRSGLHLLLSYVALSGLGLVVVVSEVGFTHF